MKSFTAVGAIVAVLCLGSETSAHAEMTTNQLLNGLNSVAGTDAVGWALELPALGMTWANSDLIARHQPPIFCLTPQPGLTRPKLIEMVRQAVRDAPVLADRPYGMALLIAMKRTFPCPSR